MCLPKIWFNLHFAKLYCHYLNHILLIYIFQTSKLLLVIERHSYAGVGCRSLSRSFRMKEEKVYQCWCIIPFKFKSFFVKENVKLTWAIVSCSSSRPLIFSASFLICFSLLSIRVLSGARVVSSRSLRFSSLARFNSDSVMLRSYV